MRDKVVNLFTTFFKLDVIRLIHARAINRLIPIYDCIKKNT